MDIQIREVSTKKELKSFIKFPNDLYLSNEYYIAPLHNKEFETLSREDNPAFEYCEARYWLAYSGTKVVGRIAAIINHKYNETNRVKSARFGWFDTINDKTVAATLMDTAENWAIENGMKFIHGPLGFISFDRSGILVEGFNELPTSFGQYNAPYYNDLITGIGYKKDADWLEFEIILPHKLADKIITTSRLVERRWKVKNVDIKSKKDIQNYADEMFQLLNTTYEGLYGFTKLSPAQLEKLKNEYVQILAPDYVSIIIDNAGKVVAFGIAMPSLAKALKKAKGILSPVGLFRLWIALRKNDTADLLLIAVNEEYQSKGIPALIINKIGHTMLREGIKYVETTRELENNIKVQSLWSNYEIRQHKRSRCYIKELIY
jgi:GNAT superfamily N-acetyltransferase